MTTRIAFKVRKKGRERAPSGDVDSTKVNDAEVAINTEPTQMGFRLLDLCAELRNKIYEMVCEETSAYIDPCSSGQLIGNSPLSGVNRQIRKEFLPVFYLYSPTIVAVIYDFDYRHVVSFLNKLGQHELQALFVKPERSMVFEMHIAPIGHIPLYGEPRYGMGLGDNPRLDSWLNRLQHPAKKGTRLKISHVMKGEDDALVWWYHVLGSLEERYEGGRANLELRDTKAALKAATPRL